MRFPLLVTALVLCAGPAFAGMTPDEIRARLLEIDIELSQLAMTSLREFRGDTLDSVREDLRDNARRQFDLDLERARVNARRDAVLIRAKEEADRRKVELDILQRKLEQIRRQREGVLNEFSQLSDRVNAGQLPASQITPLKLELVRLDEQTATVEYEMSGGAAHFGAALADLEVELAGIEAGRKLIADRGAGLSALFERLVVREEQRAALEFERADLEQSLAAQLERLNAAH